MKIDNIVRVDLDGDGEEEVLISATNYFRKDESVPMRSPAAGYSMVLLRRVVAGKVETQLIVGEFYPKAYPKAAQEEGRFDAPNAYKVIATLDWMATARWKSSSFALLRRRRDNDLPVRSEEELKLCFLFLGACTCLSKFRICGSNTGALEAHHNPRREFAAIRKEKMGLALEWTRNGGDFPNAAKALRLCLTLNTRCRFNYESRQACRKPISLPNESESIDIHASVGVECRCRSIGRATNQGRSKTD